MEVSMLTFQKRIGSLVCLAMLAAGTAQATVSGDDVQLDGTTVPGITAHVTGRIDATVPGTLVFHTTSSSGQAASADLVMPYDKVFEFGLKNEDAFHLGFFPAMFFGMVAPRPQRHTFTVSWHDANGIGQEVTFEISKELSEHLMPVMYARARSACVRTEYGACAPVVPPPPPQRIPLIPPPAAIATPTP
jgi:hypothetical protein